MAHRTIWCGKLYLACFAACVCKRINFHMCMYSWASVPACLTVLGNLIQTRRCKVPTFAPAERLVLARNRLAVNRSLTTYKQF